jgi:3-deoxy-D-manno-octulosonate 8-phosphate phosphatase (KDO 8-P phosphatase)
MSPEDARARARNIKVLIFDVDGVLTNGAITVHPNPDGSATEVKSFSAHDGLGISLARLGGVRTGVVTKRNSTTVAIRARDLKLEFVYQGQAHKMQAIASANARPQVLAAAHWVTPHAGGDGAGRDAIDFILEAQGSLARVIAQYLDESDATARASDIGVGNM